MTTNMKRVDPAQVELFYLTHPDLLERLQKNQIGLVRDFEKFKNWVGADKETISLSTYSFFKAVHNLLKVLGKEI